MISLFVIRLQPVISVGSFCQEIVASSVLSDSTGIYKNFYLKNKLQLGIGRKSGCKNFALTSKLFLHEMRHRNKQMLQARNILKLTL